jgi:hypothetical protein
MRGVKHVFSSIARHSSIVVAVVCLGCGSKGSPTTPPPANNPPPAPTLANVALNSGRTAINVGETEQFSATANFSDNSTQNVSGTATWSSANTGVATVNASGLVTAVAAGSAEIRATFQNMTGTRTVQVSAPPPPPPPPPPPQTPPVARFTVSGPAGDDRCRIIVGSGGDIDCNFNGSASTGGSGGSINRWTWRFDVGSNSRTTEENDPILNPNPGCGFFVDKPSQAGTGFVQMIVRLRVRNAAGTTSDEVRNLNVRLFPQNQCGFGF